MGSLLMSRPTSGGGKIGNIPRERTEALAANRPIAASEGMRIARNSAVLGAGQVVGVGLGFATAILVTDLLGDLYGSLIGAQRFIGLFLAVVQFGLHPLIVRAVASRRDPPGVLLGTLLAVRCGLAVVFAVLVVSVATLGNYLPEHRWVIYLLAVSEILGVLAETFVAVCQGTEQMGRSALIVLSRSSTTFVGVLGVLAIGGGLPEVVAVYVGGRCVQMVAAMLLTRRPLAGSRLEVHGERVIPYLREALPFLAIGYAVVALRSLDVVILTRLSSVADVARFGASLNFVEVFLILPIVAQRALLPAFSRLGASGGDTAIAQGSIQIFGLVLFPSAAALALLSHHALAIYPSGEFADAAPVLQVLAATLVFIPSLTIAATHLTAHGRLARILYVYAVTLPLQILGNAILIPRYGAVGAATAMVTAHGILAIGLVLGIRDLGVHLPWASTVRQWVATGLMSLALLATRQHMVLVPVAVGLLVYVAAMAVLTPADALERRLLAAIRAGRGQT